MQVICMNEKFIVTLQRIDMVLFQTTIIVNFNVN